MKISTSLLSGFCNAGAEQDMILACTLLPICNLDAPQLSHVSKLGNMQQISVSLLMSA